MADCSKLFCGRFCCLRKSPWKRGYSWKGRFGQEYLLHWASVVAQMVNNLPAMQETWVQSLGWEDPPRKGIATLFSRIPWTEEPGGL